MRSLYVAAFILFSLCACSGTKSEPQEDKVLKAYKLIDQNRAEEAVSLLTPEYKENQGDRRITIALASAYASLSGLQVYNFYDLVESTLFNKPLSKGGSTDLTFARPVLDLGKGDNVQKSRNFVSYLMKYLSYINSMLNFYQKIPTITKKQKKYLETAIALTETIEPQQKSDGLFRVVMRVVYFKYQIINDFLPSLVKVEAGNKCSLDLTGFSDNVYLSLRSIERILADLTIAYPKRESDYNKSSNDATELAQQLVSSSGNIELASDALVELVLLNMKQQNLGKEIKCSF